MADRGNSLNIHFVPPYTYLVLWQRTEISRTFLDIYLMTKDLELEPNEVYLAYIAPEGNKIRDIGVSKFSARKT